MQTTCEYCGADINITKAFNKPRRDIIKSPKTHKTIICPTCKQKNFLELKNFN